MVAVVGFEERERDCGMGCCGGWIGRLVVGRCGGLVVVVEGCSEVDDLLGCCLRELVPSVVRVGL